ncbi:hypothetical protein [Microseira sp. BLCC-F43]|jgi:hypothetical protein|uniref:hypothetical protein n=1 Tax=Microseira sp. BLCC-F43 TaxID=3153602 RepID=UPI0035B94FFA
MTYLKQKIAEILELLPEVESQEFLDFVDLLLWRNSKRKETILPENNSNLEFSDIDDSSVHYVEGVLVVKATSGEGKTEVNWENIVEEMREERIRKFIP